MQEFFKTRKFWLMLCVSLMLPLLMAQAQEEEEGEEEGEEEVDPNEWKKEREEIYKAIKAEVKKRVEAKVSYTKIVKDVSGRAKAFEDKLKPRLVAQRQEYVRIQSNRWKETYLHAYPKFDYTKILIPAWTWPTPAPKQTPEKLKSNLEARLEKEFRKAYPEKSVNELTEEGQKKYVMVKVVDGQPKPEVSFKLRGGKGVNTRVGGKLHQVTAERLRVGSRWINRMDLDDETSAMFYEDVNERFVKEYVQLEQRKYSAALENFKADWVMYLLPDELMADGYIPTSYMVKPEQRESPNLKVWISRKEFLQNIYNFLYKMETNKQTPIVEKEYFLHAADKYNFAENYEYVKEAKEWMPNTVAADYRAAQEAKLEEEKRRQQGGEPGMDGGMGPGPGMP